LLWELLVDDEPRGRVQRVTLDAPVWAAPAFGVEVMLAPVDSAPAARADERVATGVANAPTYKPLPTTPAAGFDVALLVPDAVAAADVEAVIRQAGGDLLERVLLLSEFRGEGIPAGTRSLAWRLTFRHPERTLGGKEVEGRRERMLRILESRLGVRTRG
jgi:phenylalanyl-tRNA synthetase beta chain